MNKKQQDISDRLNDTLDLMLFDGIITSEERQEFSRKMGVLFNLPDLLAYFDLRDIAISLLAEAVPIETAAAIAKVLRQEEVPDTEHKGKILKLSPRNATPTEHGENDVKGVNPGKEAGADDRGYNGEQDQ